MIITTRKYKTKSIQITCPPTKHVFAYTKYQSKLQIIVNYIILSLQDMVNAAVRLGRQYIVNFGDAYYMNPYCNVSNLANCFLN